MYHLPAPQGTFMLLTPLPFPGNRGAQRAGDNRAFMDIGKRFFRVKRSPFTSLPVGIRGGKLWLDFDNRVSQLVTRC